MPKLMSEGICMCFNKAIVQSMFKHVASENGPLVLILQSYSQSFHCKAHRLKSRARLQEVGSPYS